MKPQLPSAEKAAGLIAGVTSPPQTRNEFTQNIQKIVTAGQAFQKLNEGVMSRGLTVERFDAASPENNWQLKFPYRLVVLRAFPEGGYEEISAYRLPINPQDIQEVAAPAIGLTVTNSGILEEHNGIPLRQINVSGTTGLLLRRESSSQEDKRSDIIGTVFAGTIEAARTFTNSITTAKPKQVSNPDLAYTGYYQFQMLRLFYETYAEVKKHPGTMDLRLAFENAKDRKIYLVTPGPLVSRRSVSSPLEYTYSFSLTAWGSIDSYSGTGVKSEGFKNLILKDIGNTRKLFNTLKQLRTTLNDFKNIITAAKADVESNIFGPINDSIILTKNALSIAYSIADFPRSLQTSFQSSVVANFNSIFNVVTTSGQVVDSNKMKAIAQKVQQISNENSSSNSSQVDASSFKDDVLNDLALTDLVNISQISLNSAQQIALEQSIDRALNLNENDFRKLISELEELTIAVEQAVTSKSPVDPEWNILYDTQEAIAELYAFIADGSLETSEAQSQQSGKLQTTALSFWDEVTAQAGIDFTKPVGKYSVPFPFKGSLESLAATYLGDATRWMEIAAVNGLQAPYIDEEGFSYEFLSNGDENQFSVSKKENLFVGQTIYLSSQSRIMEPRKILRISEITTTNILITVDGPADLSSFKISEKAQMKAFLPYTVNSMKRVFIPTSLPGEADDIKTKPITFLKDDEDMIKFSRIDLLLDDNFDLAVTEDGFVNLAYGVTNLIQAAKIKLKTVKGALPLHPDFGAGIEVGESFADINLQDQANTIKTAFEADERFSTPSKIDIQVAPGIIQESISVPIRKDNGVLPIVLPLTE